MRKLAKKLDKAIRAKNQKNYCVIVVHADTGERKGQVTNVSYFDNGDIDTIKYDKSIIGGCLSFTKEGANKVVAHVDKWIEELKNDKTEERIIISKMVAVKRGHILTRWI